MSPEEIMRSCGGTTETFGPRLDDLPPEYEDEPPPGPEDEPPPEYEDDGPEYEDEEAPRGKGRGLPLIDPAEWEGVEVPPRQWIVHDWLPVGYVTADYGDGGTGKTLLAQQLQTSCATGFEWCGMQVTRCRSIGLYCEDSEDELHRRQADICREFGLLMSGCSDMRVISGVGSGNTLMTFDGNGKSRITDIFNLLRDAAIAFDARLVVLDTAADLFAGNENDRHQVRQFIGLLSKLALDINGAVLLNAHPSHAGLSNGNMDGGSTAWNNSVRSRWSLSRPVADKDDPDPPDTNERILERRKANYAKIGDTINLRWRNGVLLPTEAWRRSRTSHGTGGSFDGPGKQAAAEQVFLDLLDRLMEQGRTVSASPNAGNYAPKLFAEQPDRNGLRKDDFKKAMEALFAAKRIRMEEYRNKGVVCSRMVRCGTGEDSPT
jgi:RecA-family ATPase